MTAGYVKRPNSLHTYGWLTKYSAQGSVLWSRRYIPSLYNSIEFTKVIETAGGDFFAVGITGDKDEVLGAFARGYGLIMKLDKYGAPLWSKLFTKESLYESGSQIDNIVATKDGDFILSISYFLQLQKIQQTILQRIDKDGIIKWTSSAQSNIYAEVHKPIKYGHSLYRYFNISSTGLRQLKNGNILLAKAVNFSDSTQPTGYKGYYMLCIDVKTGARVWEKHYTYQSADQGKRSFADVKNLTELPDGSFSIISSYADEEHFSSPFSKQCLNIITGADGQLKKVLSYDFARQPMYATAAVTLNENGEQAILSDNANHPFLMKLNATGDVLWAKGYEKMGKSQETTTILATVNGFYIFSFVHDGGPKDYTFIKTDPQGNNDCIQTPISVSAIDVTTEFKENGIAFDLHPRKAVWIDGRASNTADYTLTASILCRKTCCTDIVNLPVKIDLCNKNSYTLPNGYLVKENGTYSISFKSNRGCDSLVYYNVAFSQKPVVNLGRNQCFDGRDSIILKTEAGYSLYNWQGQPSEDHFFTAKGEGIYSVSVTNGCGTQSDSIQLYKECDFEIFMPNAFTPNGDGINDLYGVPSLNNNRLVRLTIYNRWGNIVFSTTDINKKWNGVVNNLQQPTGVFVYYLVMKGLSGNTFTKSGSFTLIR